jgi:CheY-like chemotaxis protein
MEECFAMTTPQQPIRVLLADDDPIFVELASSALCGIGCTVEAAVDGAVAFHLLLQQEFDVALVDLSMPHVDGFRLIGMIRATARLRRLPIMVLTVRDDPESVEEARRLGADSYTTKPVNWSRFRPQMQAIVAAYRGEAGARAAAAVR